MTGKGKSLGTLSSNGSEHPPVPHPNSSSRKRDHKTLYIQEHLSCLDCGRSASARPLLCKGSRSEMAEKHRLNPEPSKQSGSQREPHPGRLLGLVLATSANHRWSTSCGEGWERWTNQCCELPKRTTHKQTTIWVTSFTGKVGQRSAPRIERSH